MTDSRGKPPPLWLWLNLLSLDAPLVAVVWQDFLARSFPSPLRAPGRWTLGLTVWAIYLADRLIDVRHPAEAGEPARHRFYRRHRTLAQVLLTAVGVADAAAALLWLRPAVASNGLWVAGAVLLYLAGFALLEISHRAGKKLSAALLFTTGVFLVAWTSVPDPWPLLALPASLFCALCLGNLVLIENWERRPQPRPRGWIWMLALTAGCALAWALPAGGRSLWYWATGASAVGLAALDFAGAGLSGDARRVLADAVLLTPVLCRLVRQS